MILLINTSTPVCELSFIEGSWRHNSQWQADRQLAKGLLAYIKGQLEEVGKSWADISGVVVYKGPGSFTGLRIGITVANSLAYSREVPIVGEVGDDWQQLGVSRLLAGKNDQIVLPEYGGEANITLPKK